MNIKIYLLIFAILVGSSAGELLLAYPTFGSSPSGLVTMIILVSAGFKACLVALFFQHLKDEPKALSSIVLIGLLAIIPLLTLSFLQIHTFH